MTENELLNELAKEYYVSPIEPDEITAEMLADSLNIGTRAAQLKLQKMVKAGRLTCRKAKDDRNHDIVAYKKKELT